MKIDWVLVCLMAVVLVVSLMYGYAGTDLISNIIMSGVGYCIIVGVVMTIRGYSEKNKETEDSSEE